MQTGASATSKRWGDPISSCPRQDLDTPHIVSAMRCQLRNIQTHASKDLNFGRPALLWQWHLHHRHRRALLVRPALAWRSTRRPSVNVLSTNQRNTRGHTSCAAPDLSSPKQVDKPSGRFAAFAGIGDLAPNVSYARRLPGMFGVKKPSRSRARRHNATTIQPSRAKGAAAQVGSQ